MDQICLLLNLYSLLILVRVILSWVRVTPGTAMESVASVVYSLTEPVLGPIRRAIPPMRMGMAALDLSPLIVLFAILIIC